MRSVSFVEHIQLPVKGKINPNCMVFEDIDGDDLHELIVCDSVGNVSIYKGSEEQAWYTFSLVRDVSCITAGDFYNNSTNQVLIISNNGDLDIIEIHTTNSNHLITHLVRSVKIMPNISHVLLADVKKKNKYQLLASHSDCHVSAYCWENNELRMLQIWRLQHFAGNIAIHCGVNQQTSIMVSQPGCSYAVLRTTHWDEDERNDLNTSSGSVAQADVKTDDRHVVCKPTNYNPDIDDCPIICGPEFVEFTPLSSRTRMANPNVTCQLIGDISKSSNLDATVKEPGYFALCT